MTDRVCRWLLAVDVAGLDPAFDGAFDGLGGYRVPRFAALRALVGPVQRAVVASAAQPVEFADLVGQLQDRFDAPLPPSLVAFWRLRAGSRPWRELFDALIGPKVFAPSAYLHEHGADYRLSIA